MSRVEQIADDVYVLSDLEPADSERSWLPADTKGFEPFNKYVIVKPDAVLLLETGVAAHCDSVTAPLRDIVGDRKLVVLPTRSELESIGNMGTILDAFPRVQLLTTTRALPPLGLCHIRDDKRDSIPARRIRRGENLADLGVKHQKLVDARREAVLLPRMRVPSRVVVCEHGRSPFATLIISVTFRACFLAFVSAFR